MDSVVYLDKTDEKSVLTIMTAIAENGGELVTVVPKIESPLVGLTHTVGLWFFFRVPATK